MYLKAGDKPDMEETLYLKPITAGSPERELLDKMYAEAFPANEWQPGCVKDELNVSSQVWKAEEWLIMDGDTPVGPLSAIHTDKYAYLLYLAVSPRLQGKGYGSRVLALFKKLYPNHIRFFDLEVPDKSAGNAAQREARIRFYERNGYHLVDFEFEYHGVKLVVMTDSDEFELTPEVMEICVAE